MYRLFFLLPLFLFSTPMFGQEKQKGEARGEEEKVISAYYDQGVFHIPDDKAFLETYISIDGGGLHYLPDENGERRSRVEVTVIVQKGDSIVDFDKTVSSAPLPEDSGRVENLIDLKRFPLDTGFYSIQAELKDLNADSARTFSIRSRVRIPELERDSLHFSDLQLVHEYERTDEKGLFVKSGLRLIPYVANYYPPRIDELTFYTELYNADKVLGSGEKLYFRYYLHDRERDKLMSDFHNVKIRKSGRVNPFLATIDIEKLPTGNYDLVLEARNEEHELLSRRSTFIQRNGTVERDEEDLMADRDRIENTFVKDMDHEDSLRMYIDALAPIAGRVEQRVIDGQLEVMDMETMKRFLYGFWFERDPQRPEKKWLGYKSRVDFANKEYSGAYKRGYETDRGETLLKYGRPDRIDERKHKTHSYPYEIWQYYKIGKYTNKRFVFYNTDLATGDYDLLHSDMPGELRNRRWRRQLQNRQNVMDRVDEERTPDHYGREVDDLFRNP